MGSDVQSLLTYIEGVLVYMITLGNKAENAVNVDARNLQKEQSTGDWGISVSLVGIIHLGIKHLCRGSST